MALSKSSKAFLIAVLGLLGVAALVIGGGYWWVNQQVAGTPGEGDPVTLEIPQGAAAGTIGQLLAEEEIIRNELAFRLIARSRGVDSDFSSGTYELETGMSVDEVLAALAEDPIPPETVRFTVPEGLTVNQTLERMADATPYDVDTYRTLLDEARQDRENGPLQLPEWVPPSEEFAADVEMFEGLLFPQTYEFEKDVAAERILQRMLDETEVAMASASPSAVQAAESEGLTKYDALIIASLVEREARVAGEWDEIAAVIRNRIDEGMLLQIDATLLYAAGTPDGGPGAVDTEVESPYNTYQNEGLPPTPISGARREAIQGVFEPAESDYLYYVVSPECDGSHNFAETNEEHNQNVQAFRDAGGCEE